MRALLIVHDVDPETGAPTVPQDWTVTLCGNASAPWYDVTHPSGRRVVAYRENDDGSVALWAVFGAPDDLTDLAAITTSDMPAREAWRRRSEPAVKARLRYWRTLRCSGQERDGEGNPVPFTNEVRNVIPRGAQLPDYDSEGFPWNLGADGSLTTAANAVIRVESVSGVDTLALSTTLAGHGYPTAFADEADPEA